MNNNQIPIITCNGANGNTSGMDGGRIWLLRNGQPGRVKGEVNPLVISVSQEGIATKKGGEIRCTFSL